MDQETANRVGSVWLALRDIKDAQKWLDMATDIAIRTDGPAPAFGGCVEQAADALTKALAALKEVQ